VRSLTSFFSHHTKPLTQSISSVAYNHDDMDAKFNLAGGGIALPFQECTIVPDEEEGDPPLKQEKTTNRMNLLRAGSISKLQLPSSQNNTSRPEDIPSKIVLKRTHSPPYIQAPPSPLPFPSPFSILRKRTSSSSSVLLACYQGPTPLGRDGKPLKSCIKGASSSGSTASVSTVSTLPSTVVPASPPDEKPPCSITPTGRRVSFSHVKIREYCRVPGDNPSVSCGAPLSIGWKYNKRGTIDIDSYEADKACKECYGECRRLSPEERSTILSEIGGHGHRQIMTATFDASLEHQRRWDTIDQLGGLGKAKYVGPMERAMIIKESAARKIDRACKGTSKSKQQKLLWEQAQESARRKSLL